MPPAKGRGSAAKAAGPTSSKKRRTSGAGAGEASALPPLAIEEAIDIEGGHVAMQGYLKLISDNPILQDLPESEPRTLQEGARVAPLDNDAFNTRFTAVAALDKKPKDAFYTCTGVFSWVNALFSFTPKVQISEANIDRIISHHFAEGPPESNIMPFEITIAVPACNNFLEQKGTWRAVSPTEPIHAAVKACGKCLESPQSTDDMARRWKDTFRSTVLHFVHQPEHLWTVTALQLRENPLIDADNVAFTAHQRMQLAIAESTAVEARQGTRTAAKLSRHFLDNVKFASQSEQFTVAFIEAAPPLHVSMLDTCSLVS